MPAKGKHRRTKTPRLSRAFAAVGTGGAALALPLLGAGGAHAAPARSGQAAQSAQVTGRTTPAEDAGARTYTVRPGDSLSEIAAEQRVRGGWPALYADNRQAVGDDPSLIHPGLRLGLGGQATAAGTVPEAESAQRPPSSAAAPSTATPAAKRATVTRAAAATSAGYTLPVDGAAIGTGYHVPGGMWSSGHHTGVDFVVPAGTPVKAVAAGTVVSAGWGGAYGNQVVIRLHDGRYAQYAHLSSLSVAAGQAVSGGQRVGLSGATGNVTGPHLHFEIRTTPDYGSDLDPVAYLSSHGVTVG